MEKEHGGCVGIAAHIRHQLQSLEAFEDHPFDVHEPIKAPRTS
jgi:hypothetical protein